jgi:hypothetical protein
VCFVTNLGEEKPQEEKKIRVTQQFLRDGVPLSETVTEDMFEAIADESISLEDMDYWFKENSDDIVEERFLEPLEEVENEDFTVRNESWDSVRRLMSVTRAFLLRACVAAKSQGFEGRSCCLPKAASSARQHLVAQVTHCPTALSLG